ncbi:unnamed protein product [Cuscuta epithymum]|uniref:Uncharacterized protein n=1 Tax=Cuscuta epithymum TaxID=186058 RepID=A0AAV0DDS9_9ASTE|nr:unnamed protein product [Cuscuta epithymum]
MQGQRENFSWILTLGPCRSASSSRGEEDVLEKALRWVQALGFPKVEVEASFSQMEELGSRLLDRPHGFIFSIIPVQVNKAAGLVARFGLLGRVWWQRGDAIPQELRGAIALDAASTPYVI